MPRVIGKLLGRRIRRIRQEKGLTLKQIEGRVGVSATHISEIERGKTSPTIGALEKISTALEVPPSHLIDVPAVPDLNVRRREDSRPLQLSEGAVKIEPLTSRDTASDMSIFYATIEGNGKVETAPGHGGEEFCYVLQGFMEVTVGTSSYFLKQGDSIHFKATQPHHIRNLSQEPVQTIWSVRPKLFI
jgi:transcriptional regulator with XRE-family HTH domain